MNASPDLLLYDHYALAVGSFALLRNSIIDSNSDIEKYEENCERS